uniref:Uncharacterized protein n=1 Tax=Setaria viridis TaxID=4556 RepID=A0A4U6UNY9_SETVI|nr:hypothetical protein SEVIR_5G332700v2 [Setaria viridis]
MWTPPPAAAAEASKGASGRAQPPVGRGLGRSSLPPAAAAGELLRAKTPPKPACAAAAAARALTSGHRRLPQGCRRACRHAPLLPGAGGHVRQPLLYGDEAARAGPQPVQDRCCWDHRRWIGRRRLGCKDAAAGCWGAGGSTPPLTQGRWRACRGRGCRRIVSRRATVAAGHCKTCSRASLKTPLRPGRQELHRRHECLVAELISVRACLRDNVLRVWDCLCIHIHDEMVM